MSSIFTINPPTTPLNIAWTPEIRLLSVRRASRAPDVQQRYIRLRWMLIVLLVAAVLRIINAGHFSVWTDEGWSTWAISDHQVGTIVSNLAADRHPPLYFLALSAWSSVAGDSRLALRFLSIGAGLLIVALTYRIGVEWFGYPAGLCAALVFAVLPSAVYYAQEVRNYEWLTLAALLMTLFFLRILRRPRRSTLIAYAISTAFMLYTLYIGVFLLALHGIIGLFFWRGTARQKSGLIGAWLLAALLYLPWLPSLLDQLHHLSAGVVSDPNTLDGWLHAIQDLISPQYALIGAVMLIGGWAIVRRSKSDQRFARLIIVWSGAGLFGIMALANLKVGTLSNHTIAFLLPACVLLAGYGLASLPQSARLPLLGMAVIGAILTPGIVQPRLDYPAAAQAVAADYSPGDLIVLETGWDDDAFRYELIQALGESSAGSIITTLAWVNNYTPNVPVVPQIQPQIGGARRVWVVNWLQPAQVIPFLDQGGDGFQRAITRQTPVGAQYATLYPDPTVREVLYLRPPSIGVRNYGGLFTLDSVLFSDTIEPGKPLHVDLWWTAAHPPPHDYSIGVFLLDAHGKPVAQQDSPPGNPADATPTSQWGIGTQHYDRHTLTIPANLPPDRYQIGVAVYWYGDGKRLTVTGAGGTPANLAIIGQVQAP